MTKENFDERIVEDLEDLLSKLNSIDIDPKKIKIDEKAVEKILFEKVLPYKIDRYKVLGKLDGCRPNSQYGNCHEVPLPIYGVEGHTKIKEIIDFVYDANQYPHRDDYANIQWIYHALFIKDPDTKKWERIYFDFARNSQYNIKELLFESEPYDVRDRYFKKAIRIFKEEKKKEILNSRKKLEEKIAELKKKCAG